ncbi:MAG: hypothetical protein JRH20_12765 [Deltaproteobacteria bacterium]|nr:hypothetical protein [Deltaproteobacteria bacterium]
MTTCRSTLFFATFTLLVCTSAPALAQQGAPPASRVIFNGRPLPVFFNDGDSFRVLSGPKAGMKARLMGFNTLESYGKAHGWGGWTQKELYWFAKLATLNARRGVWHCKAESEERDVYGRRLLYCQDLAIDQIKRGYAHVMSVNAEPGRPELVEAQLDAIKHRRGMWAHGVPYYVLTSLHSISEGGGRDGKTYNRLVSTLDGHSAKWRHTNSYKLCEEVCFGERVVPLSVIQKATKTLTNDADLKLLVTEIGASRLLQMVADFARLGYFVGLKDVPSRTLLARKLRSLQSAGELGGKERRRGSCMVYVPFKQRYGRARVGCLD